MPVDTHITDPALTAVLETSKAAREQALALIDLVIQEKTAAGGEQLPVEAHAAISRQQKLLNTNLAHLRGLHRAAHFRARETKGQTAEARHEVDVLHLQLQNLYYEQRHLEGEIENCESFNHKYQELPLIPVEEFLSFHPELADADENALMVARINHERTEREALEQQRLELQKRKQKLIADNKKRRDDLASLDKDLEKFIDVRDPC
ncbi:Fms-interacting protein-domain-containing protein [Lasiosphaeria miniovina]|uniref:Fms-interacting protein-domain-containing protein n=1 Tax=Lasiosphaeria miniovina TaxID=1954250 RepID=A0AA40BIJ0_9PEZI|nr:Fms-interacting protein-domain-containing protein [Lasiosphaeria miniovina]KAK0734859.1 Fms-interacting protein-domain-containing protein [Lasiosphaeria miniovina]